MEQITLDKLTPEQRAELLAEVKAAEKKKEEQRKAEKKVYKEIAAGLVDDIVGELQRVSDALSLQKRTVFQEFESVISMKQELYGVKTGQQSFTFSNEENTARISIGYRVLDRYDDTANEGIAIVREYLDSLVSDAKSRKLMNFINDLLKRDKNGNLKASRVLDLKKVADDEDSEELKRGVDIIIAAYKPEKSAYYVEAEVRTAHNQWKSVPLSISSADFPVGFEVKF